MSDQLIYKLSRCIVYLAATPGVSEGGTGFFAAPGTIVTCLDTIAPVSAIGDPAIEERDLEVYWAGKPFVARIDRYAHHPGVNLALLRCNIDLPHDCALLHNLIPLQNENLYTCGYRDASTPAMLQPTFDRQAKTEHHHLLQFVSTQDTQGFNGAPLLDLRTGGVCGIVLGPQKRLVVLRKILGKHFDLDEIRTLCYKLGLDYEELPGEKKSRKIESLVDLLQTSGRFADVLPILKRDGLDIDIRELEAAVAHRSLQTVDNAPPQVPETPHLRTAIATDTILSYYPELIDAQQTFFEQEWRADPTHAWMRLLSLKQKLDMASKCQPARLPIPPCPFPGLRPFDKGDHQNFYGRQAEIDQIKHALDMFKLVALIGQSGSGKTSIVRAGILPDYEDEHRYLILTLAVPSNQPFESLRNLLQGDPEQGHVITNLLTQANPAQRVLLIIDQFEQWLVQAKREDTKTDWNRFIQAIKRLRDDGRVCVLIIVRSDFYGELRATELIQEHIGSKLIDIDPLRGDKLRDAIQSPAAQLEVRVETSLVERLIAEADPQGKQPGALPLLQEVLRRIWYTLQRPEMTLDRYEQIGKDGRSGMRVAIEQLAEDAWRQLRSSSTEELNSSQPLRENTWRQRGSSSPKESTKQRIAQHIFLKLVVFTDDLGPGIVRRQCTKAELSVANEHELFEATLNVLRTQGLLVMDEIAETPIVEIAHDALIEHWPRLKGWLVEFSLAIQQQRRFEARTKEWRRWQAEGRHDDGWLHEGELQEALRWRREYQEQLGSVEDLDALIRGTQAYRRTRGWMVVFAVAAFVLLALGLFLSAAYMQSR